MPLVLHLAIVMPEPSFSVITAPLVLTLNVQIDSPVKYHDCTQILTVKSPLS